MCPIELGSRRMTLRPVTAVASMSDREDSARHVEFLRAFAGACRRIFACVLSIVPQRDEADEVVQDVCAVL